MIERETTTGLMGVVWICVTILLVTLIVVGEVVVGRKKARKMPPGRRGWPLVGDTYNWFDAVASSHPPRFVHQQVLQFGKIFSCSIFGKWAVVSADPIFNKFVMQNEGKLFKSSYPKSFRDLVGKHGVITVHGDQQRKLHAIASNLMRLDKLKSSHLFNDVQLLMLRTLNNNLMTSDNQFVSLQDVCRKASLINSVAINLMVNQLLGVSNESEVNEMARLFSDFVDGCLSVPINLPGFAYHTAMKARGTIINKIKSIIEKHRQLAEAAGSSNANASATGGGVLGRLLEEEKLPDHVVADFIINLLFAGNETTAKTMLFAVYFLAQCPAAMKQILVEQENLKRDREMLLTWEDYKAMSFTQSVIDETLRLGGIAIWLMREAEDDVKYQDYVIPKGCFVVPFLSAVHLDENLYNGASSFNPWRWMDPENQEKRNWRSSPFYTPFGGGGRLCPGAELSRLQISLFLHYFLTTYT
ncbi:Cytochrome P450 [Dillenia turbinata]|uniref:Cytochrome P450 n=1 Tax=Dillenia turbinata TaxID=194707 RepID=A0AAN8YZW8_9MAGN